MNGSSIGHGITAGFIATVALSILMLAKSMMGLMPQVDPIADIVKVADGLTGATLPKPAGWIGHFLIGSVAWGVIYTALEPHLPGSAVVRGLIFGVLAWLAMMVVFMPMAGHGFFAIALGPMAMMATLMLHLVYGAVLGVAFARLAGAGATGSAAG